MEIDVLAETFAILKQYIPSKDRQEAADNLISVLVDVLSDEDLKALADSDSTLARAIKDYASDFDEDDDYYED